MNGSSREANYWTSRSNGSIQFIGRGIGAFGFNSGVFIGMHFDGKLLRQADIALPCRASTNRGLYGFGGRLLAAGLCREDD